MKKSIKRIISTVFAAAASLSLSLTSFAKTTAGDLNFDDMTLISEENIYDSNTGLYYVDKTYVKELPIDDSFVPPSLDIDAEEFKSEYKLITKVGYTDSESGLYFVDRTYVKEDADTAVAVNSVASETQAFVPFSKYVIKTRAVYSNPSTNVGELIFIMDAWGTFYANNENEVWVTNANRYTERYNPTATYTEVEFRSASKQGANFLFGHAYACIEYIIYVDIPNGYKGDVRLWIDVNNLGVENVQT